MARLTMKQRGERALEQQTKRAIEAKVLFRYGKQIIKTVQTNIGYIKAKIDVKESQLGRCAICNKYLGSNSKFIHWDHCHQTGEKRGLLCHNCNIGLGHFKDNIHSLQNAIEYILKYRGIKWTLPDEIVIDTL